MDSSSFSKWLIILGLGIALIGIFFWLSNKIGIPFGKLPGDIFYQKDKYGIYFPIVTSVVLSILLTLLFNFISWILKK